MLNYNKLKDRPRDFLAATGLTLAECEELLPAFQATYEKQYPPELTREGKPRQRRAGGGAKGTLPSFTEKLLFILVYQKTNPLQTMQGLHCGLSQPQANFWLHHLFPVVQQALADVGLRPEREAHQQFPLMPWEPYATMEAASAVRVSTIHCRLLKSVLDATCQAGWLKADASRAVGRALSPDGRSPG